MKRKPHSEETKRKISIANKGRIFTEEWKKNLSNAHKGKTSPRKGKKYVDEAVSLAKRKEYKRKWRIKNRDRMLKLNREFYKRNAEKMCARSRDYYHENKQAEHDRVRYKKYGITGDEFREIVESQNNKCPICLLFIKKNFSVDHCHDTGKVRGVICNNCNLAIGNALNSPQTLRALADYLDKHETT